MTSEVERCRMDLAPEGSASTSSAKVTRGVDYCDDDEEEEEEEPYSAHDEDITLLPTRRSMSHSPSKSSTASLRSSRSRISRASSSRSNTFTRFNDYMLDIIDADDMLPDVELSTFTSETVALPEEAQAFFTSRDGQTLLRVEVFGKIVSLLRSCGTSLAKSTKSGRSSLAPSSDDVPSASSMDADDVSRLLKILHRCMRDGQSLDPFVDTTKKRTAVPASASSSKRSRPLSELSQNTNCRRSNLGEEDKDIEFKEKAGQLELTSRKMAILAYCSTAAHCALSLLGSSVVPIEICTDDAVLPCLQVMRSALLNAVMPFVHACAGHLTTAPQALNEFVAAFEAVAQDHRTSKAKKNAEVKNVKLPLEVDRCRHHLSKTFETLQHLLSHVSTVVARGCWSPSDSCVSLIASTLMQVATAAGDAKSNSSTTKSTSLSFIFADDKGTEGTLLSSLRVPALQTLQGFFTLCNADQQSFIIQTILDYVAGSDSQSQAKTRSITTATTGKSVDSVSLLMLQLIQGSTKDVRLTMVEAADANLALSQESARGQVDKSVKADMEALQHLMDDPRSVAGQFAEGLFAKMKSSKGGESTSAGGVVEGIVADLSQAMLRPEWPGASLLLSCLTRLLCNALDDRNTSIDVRVTALDVLGAVTARLCESLARMRVLTDSEAKMGGTTLGQLEGLLESKDASSILLLEEAYEKLIRHTVVANASTAANRTQAARFLRSQWAVELASIHRRLNERMETIQVAGIEESTTQLQGLTSTLNDLGDAVQRLEHSANDVSAAFSYRQVPQKGDADSYQLLYEAVLHSFSFMVPCETIFAKLIEASSGPVASHRAKAIRALSSISEADDNFLLRFDVRSAVQRCLLDESVNVRDGAVALLGRFVLAKPQYIEPLFNSLKAKIDDTGLMVRKRCLRLLAEIYKVSCNECIRVEALCEIVRSAHDPEQSMQELALQITVQIMLKKTGNTKARTAQSNGNKSGSDVEQDCVLDGQILAFAAVAERSVGSKSALDDILAPLLQMEEINAELKEHLTMMTGSLVDKIVSATCEAIDSKAIRLAKLLQAILRCLPIALSVTLAKQMLPCVKTCTSNNELQFLASILDCFNVSLPSMGKVAITFAQRLQDNLRPLISQPSPHLSLLPELVRCYALVVLNHTGDYAILIKMLQQCHQLLCAVVSRARSRKNVVVANRNDAVVIRLIALLVDHIDFDKVRLTNADVAVAINLITRRSIREEALTLFMRLVDNESFLPHALYGMRFLFRSSPQLMLQDEVRASMSRMLTGQDMLQEKSIIIKTIADILSIEEEQRRKQEICIGHGELAGNLETLAEPVSFEIVQLFLGEILGLIAEPSLQAPILDILQHIIMRGMCHPMECLPSLVALETYLDSPIICDKARFLHSHLIAKVGTNISFRYGVCARSAWQMHSRLHGGSKFARGYLTSGCQSCLQPWFDTVVDQQTRPSRFDMLNALCKAFDVQMDVQGAELDDEDVQYARFVAEALSTLDMRTIDEIQTVLSRLDAVLDVAGEQVRIFAMEEVEVDGEEEQDEDELEEDEIERVVQVGRMASVLTYALYLRQHLIDQYGVPAANRTRGHGPSANTVKPLSKAIARKQARMPVSWTGIPGHGQKPRKTAYQHAKAAMGFFDDVMTE